MTIEIDMESLAGQLAREKFEQMTAGIPNKVLHKTELIEKLDRLLVIEDLHDTYAHLFWHIYDDYTRMIKEHSKKWSPHESGKGGEDRPQVHTLQDK